MAEMALQSVLDSFAASEAPSVAVGLVDNTGTFLTAGAGNATAHTTFLTASISKTVVALLCMQSVERRELDLDQDINHYIAGLVPRGVRNPNFADIPITLRHLLTHSSGLSDDESTLTNDRWRTKGRDCHIPLHAYITQRLVPSDSPTYEPAIWSLSAPPGSAQWHYSNAGMATAGLVLECCTGLQLEALAQQRLFKPLGMEHSTFSLDRALSFPDLAQPHLRSTSGLQPQAHYGVVEYPAAMLRSSVDDLCLYLSSLTAPAERGILTPESVHKLMPTAVDRNGECVCAGGLSWWGMDTWYGDPTGQCFSHGGFMPGVRTHIYFWPTLQAGAVLLTNAGAAYDEIERAIKQVLVERHGAKARSLFSRSTIPEIECSTQVANSSECQVKPSTCAIL